MENKKIIRKRIINKRNMVSEEERDAWSKRICDIFMQTEEYKNAGSLLCFIPYQSEVDIIPVIEDAIGTGKKVYAPLVEGEDMNFYQIESIRELKLGYKGILEPDKDISLAYPKTCNTDLMIMPGVAFDEKCNRIGYGKGFYDKYISKGFAGKRIAVAFDLQIVKEGTFEVEETDILPQCVITEDRIIRSQVRAFYEKKC